MLELARIGPLGLSWGDWPTWLATVGAIVAAFFAGWALRIEMRRDAHRQHLEDQATEQALAAQASTVAAWPTSKLFLHDVGAEVPGQLRRQMNRWVGGVRVQNSSHVPVYKMTITLWRAGAHEAETSLPLVAPGLVEIPEDKLTAHYENWRSKPDGKAKYAFEDYQVEIVFTDSSNLRWRRGIDGRLERVTSS